MLYIMRHGRTDWNDLRKLQGRTDIPLNDAGREMAEAARKEYADVHFDICFCSPLIRARETAEIVLRGRDIPIVPDDRLKEMSFGECEGLENSFGISDCKVNVLFREPEKYTDLPEGAESLEELFARTGEFLREKAGRHELQHCLPAEGTSRFTVLERRNRKLPADGAAVGKYCRTALFF